MPRLSKVALLLVVMLVVSVGALAQTVTPIPEMKNWQFAAGKWVCQEEVRTKSDGPWEKVSWTEEFRWIGNAFVEGRFSGYYSGVEFFGYDPQQKTRFGIGFNAKGEQSRWTDEWTADRTLKSQGTTVTTDGSRWEWRCTWEHAADFRSSSFTCEQMTDGKWWPDRKVKCTRQ